MSDELVVAGLVASRICHDLISPVGAIGNGLELLGPSGGHDEVMDLIADCAGAASATLQFLRLAFGARDPAEAIGRGELEAAAAAHFSRRKVTLDWSAAPGSLRFAEARPLLLLALAAASALPRGGALTLTRAEPEPLALEWRVSGSSVSLSPRTAALIDARPAVGEVAPGEAHLILLWLLAERAGARPWRREADAAFGVS